MALGLAIVFGLMGVINMAHGELMALGAYTTFVVQGWFPAHLPGSFDYYFLVALPISFLVSGAAGFVLERGVIRFLYGRPLETLLLTWGISLIIQQGLRLWFGAANVDVAAPRWLSGGIPVMIGVQLPYNRIFIIGLAAVSVTAMYLLLFRTDAGLRIRAVTQNRGMAACLGVRARWVDAATFALGAGLAGLAGCAITQIGNVGPELGQNYIVDSFMVVVTGGVGKLLGSIIAALGIGGLNKIIEPSMGAVFGKVLILVVVILFIQRRPSGCSPPRAATPMRERLAPAGRRHRARGGHARAQRAAGGLAAAHLGLHPEPVRQVPRLRHPRARHRPALGLHRACCRSATACSSASAPTPWACT